MGRTARTVLSRISPLSWAATVVLAAAHLAVPLWLPGVGGLIIVTAALGIAGTLSGAVEGTHDACIDMLLGALLETRPSPEPAQQSQSHRSAALADRSRTAARPGSARLSGAEGLAG